MALDPSAVASPLPAAGVWFRDLLAELDAGANPRDLAVRVLNESTMLLPILTAHLSWEMARAAIAADSAAARRYAELFLYLADPSYSRRPVAAPKASTSNTPQGAHVAARHAPKEEPRFPGLYL